jgi:N-acetylglucosamine malate deacetylase 2
MIRGMFWILGTLVVLFVVSTWILVYWAKSQLHNTEIEVRASLVEEDHQVRFMTFFAHPDDEVACGGTLLQLRDAGHELVMVCLTKGEAGPTGGLVSQDQLGETRAKELQAVADLLGAKKLELFGYPDSGMKGIDPETLKALAMEMILLHKPNYIISYDSRVGLYGHPDHVAVSKAMEEVFLENKDDPDFPVKQLFQLTLSPKQIQVALQLAPGFQRNYPKSGPGLPVPDFAVRTTPYFGQVKQMMAAHATQQQVFRDLLPYHEQVPGFLYARVFDREYFWEVR